MDMDQAAVWLAGSILTVLGFVVVVIGVLVVNNLLHKYWKPVRIFTADSFNLYGHSQYIEPKVDPNVEATKGRDRYQP